MTTAVDLISFPLSLGPPVTKILLQLCITMLLFRHLASTGRTPLPETKNPRNSISRRKCSHLAPLANSWCYLGDCKTASSFAICSRGSSEKLKMAMSSALIAVHHTITRLHVIPQDERHEPLKRGRCGRKSKRRTHPFIIPIIVFYICFGTFELWQRSL